VFGARRSAAKTGSALRGDPRPSGVSTGKEEDKLGLKGSSTTDLYLENVPSRKTTCSASRARFKYAMEILNDGRVSLAAAPSAAPRR